MDVWFHTGHHLDSFVALVQELPAQLNRRERRERRRGGPGASLFVPVVALVWKIQAVQPPKAAGSVLECNWGFVLHHLA
jgi:hypothetical protein